MAQDSIVDLLMRGVQGATTPLVPQISQGWDALANLVDDPNTRGNRGPIESTIRGGIAGGMQGLGNVAADLTSPLGLASLGAGGGLSTLAREAGATANATKNVARGVRGAKAASKAIDYAEMPAEFWPVGSEPASRFVEGSKAAIRTRPMPSASDHPLARLARLDEYPQIDLTGKLNALAGETGAIDTEMLTKLGLGGAAAGYGIPKLLQLARNLRAKVNPFDAYAEKVKPPQR